MSNFNVQNAFYAPAGTVIAHRYDEAEQVANLISGGICEWCYIEGKKTLITL